MKKYYLVRHKEKKGLCYVISEFGEGIMGFDYPNEEYIDKIKKDFSKLVCDNKEKIVEEVKLLEIGEDDMTYEWLQEKNFEWDMSKLLKDDQETEEEREIREAIMKLDPEVISNTKLQVNLDSSRHGDVSVNFNKIAGEIGKILGKKVTAEKVSLVYFKLLTK